VHCKVQNFSNEKEQESLALASMARDDSPIARKQHGARQQHGGRNAR